MNSERDKIKKTVETWGSTYKTLEDYELIYGHGQWDKLTDHEKDTMEAYYDTDFDKN